MSRLGSTCLALLGALSLAACGGGNAEGGGGGDEGGGDAADLSAYQGPIASNDVATGEQLYNDVCMACHASSHPLANLGWDAPRMRHQIRTGGGGGMPAIGTGQMSDEQMEAVLAFMVTNGAVMDAGGSAGGETESTGVEEDDESLD
ncbi:MAG: cytochrome c [Sandaracinaceae bacterium]